MSTDSAEVLADVFDEAPSFGRAQERAVRAVVPISDSARRGARGAGMAAGKEGVRAGTDVEEALEDLVQSADALSFELDGVATVASQPRKAAQQIRSALRQLLRREVGTPRLGDGIEQFFRKLWGHREMEALACDVVRQSEVLLSTSISPASEQQVLRMLEAFRVLLDWYAKRKESFLLLESHRAAWRGDHLPPDESVFGVHVGLDACQGGVAGLLASARVAFLGRGEDTVWLVANVSKGSRAIYPAPGWESWTFPAGISGAALAGQVEDAPFAVAIPIVARGQATLVDDARLFIPYAALDVESGASDLALTLSLVDRTGNLLCAQREDLTVVVPHQSRTIAMFPSPQEAGFFRHDPVVGDRVVRCEGRVLKVDQGSSGEQHVIEFAVGVELFEPVAGPHVVELRLFDRDGNSILARGHVKEPAGVDHPWLGKGVLTTLPDRMNYHELLCRVPLAQICLPFELDHRLGEVTLLMEMVVKDAVGRVRVGDHAQIDFQRETHDDMTLVQEEHDTNLECGVATVLRCRGVTVDPEWELRSERCARVALQIECPEEFRASYLRVVLSIESDRGETLACGGAEARLMMKGLVVSMARGEEGGAHRICREVVATFRGMEIESSLEVVQSQSATLVARARIYTVSNELVGNQTQTFIWRRGACGAAKSLVAPQEVSIVDVFPWAWERDGSVACRAIVNIDRSRFPSPTVVPSGVDGVQQQEIARDAGAVIVYHEIIGRDGEVLTVTEEDVSSRKAGADGDLPGIAQLIRVPVVAGLPATRHPWLQLSIPLQCQVGPGQSRLGREAVGSSVRVMLFSAEGTLKDVVQQPLFRVAPQNVFVPSRPQEFLRQL